MSLEHLELGPVPNDEECYQTGVDDDDKIRNQAIAWKHQLQRLYPDAQFRIKGFPHDFGIYYEVCVFFDPDNEAESDMAFTIEANLPNVWDDKALDELRELNLEIA